LGRGLCIEVITFRSKEFSSDRLLSSHYGQWQTEVVLSNSYDYALDFMESADYADRYDIRQAV